MADTAQLSLPLLAAAQAQKHVTVNEAFTRLDALYMLSAKSRGVATPPGGAVEGDRYIVPAGASGAWAGQTGLIAFFVNGGWDFVAPLVGWRAWIEDEALEVVFASGVWAVLGAGALSGVLSVLEFEHDVIAGPAHDTAGMIPAGALLHGVTARVSVAIAGATAWSLGVSGAATRFGAGLGIALNDVVPGPCGAPLAYPADTPLRLTPEGANFTGGRVKFAIHYLTLAAPAIV